MVINLRQAVNWNGHACAFVLRVIVDHVEGQRYLGDPQATHVATRTLIEVLEEHAAPCTFALLGITAELFPELARRIAAQHSLSGYSMFGDSPYAGQPWERQARDMRRMRDAIRDAAGVEVRSLVCPQGGLADEQTLRAAMSEGVEYVVSRLTATRSKAPRVVGLQGSERPLVIPGEETITETDWSDRRRDWPRPGDPFSAAFAERRWRDGIDRAKDTGTLFVLEVRSWMLHANGGELRAVDRAVQYARESGAWIATDDAVCDLAHGRL